jgi:hypothetical protein
MATQFTEDPIETLDDWNAVLSNGCCCTMPVCPLPTRECRSAFLDIYAPSFIKPEDDPPPDPPDPCPSQWRKKTTGYDETLNISLSSPPEDPPYFTRIGEFSRRLSYTNTGLIGGQGPGGGDEVGDCFDGAAFTWEEIAGCVISGFYEEKGYGLDDDDVRYLSEEKTTTILGKVLDDDPVPDPPEGQDPYGPCDYWVRFIHKGYDPDGTVQEGAIDETYISRDIEFLWTATSTTFEEVELYENELTNEDYITECLAMVAAVEVSEEDPVPACHGTACIAATSFECFDFEATKVKFRWTIPDTHEGSYFKITWDEVFFPTDESTPTVVNADKTWTWEGPGDPDDDDTWKSGWYELAPPSTPGEVRVVNVRFECYEGPYGTRPQTTGESYAIPAP